MPADRDRRAWVLWLQVTAAGAAAMTALDAVLLQQSKAFFTGGFLATTYTRTAPEALAFLFASFVVDAAAIAPLVVLALWLFSRLPLTTPARALAALAVSLTPLVIADFVAYRLASYLGDAFDLSLMFDLTGRSAGEIAAVASRHLIGPVLLIVAATAAAAALVWGVNRLTARNPRLPLRVPVRLFALAAALSVSGIAATAIISAESDTFDAGLQRKPSGRVAGRLTELVTDVDRDGYGFGGVSSDPDPFNAAVYPYALDVPGNGVDEDGVGGDLPAGAPPYVESSPAPVWIRKPDVVLVVLESFRADAVGRMLNGKPVTPVLDDLARRGVSASMALSHNGYTAQSRFHIFSGSLAGLRGGRTLVDDFKQNGYEVAYFSGQDDSFGGPAYSSGFERADVEYDARQDRGRRYTTFTTAGSLAVPFDVVEEHVSAFLAHRDARRPLFLFVNFHDTHYPYRHAGIRALVSDAFVKESQIEPARSQAVHEMYFNTAANVDAAIGATLAMVQRSLPLPPGIIVMSDHGESLFDEGFLGHGYALNDIQTHIPLIVSGLPLAVQEPFGQVDLRDALGAALAAPAGDNAPRVAMAPGKRVFQYLGRIERPKQIAFAAAGTRTIYDFRTGRVQSGGGAWVRPGDLTEATRAEFLELIRLWERMMLARAAAAHDVRN